MHVFPELLLISYYVLRKISRRELYVHYSSSQIAEIVFLETVFPQMQPSWRFLISLSYLIYCDQFLQMPTTSTSTGLLLNDILLNNIPKNTSRMPTTWYKFIDSFKNITAKLALKTGSKLKK